MKHTMKTGAAKIFSLLLIFCAAALCLPAQNASGNLKDAVPAKQPAWYEHPWIWIVSAAVGILILVSLPAKKSKTTTTEM
ncbi:hypothetical protein [Parafilimonas sp.]|uniref:hypothetical protein n=1 Tax=Parafilimonas sp. TaxID=1969739 RepID=UPI0039E3DEE5